MITRRLISRSLAGTLRKLVAVGTARLRCMLATIMALAPRMRLPASSCGAAEPSAGGVAAGVFAGAAAAGACAGAGAAVTGAAGAVVATATESSSPSVLATA